MVVVNGRREIKRKSKESVRNGEMEGKKAAMEEEKECMRRWHERTMEICKVVR